MEEADRSLLDAVAAGHIRSAARLITRVERELLWARSRGLKIPDYVAAAFREAVELAQTRSAA